MRVFKWIAIALGGIVLLVLLFVSFIYFSSNSKIDQEYAVEVTAFDIPGDSVSIAEGRHIAVSRGCTDCHGDNLAGSIMMDNPAMGRFISPNLTAGNGGLGTINNTEDWIRGIRFGVGHDKRPLYFMPAEEYYYMSDQDLAALLSYINSVPVVDNELPEDSFGPVSRMLIAFGKMQAMPEKITKFSSRMEMPIKAETREYGQYLAYNCLGCHRSDFSGGKMLSGDPSWPAAANLTQDEEQGLGEWQKGDFFRAMREGINKDGGELHEAMPRAFGFMTDEELGALWLFLQSIPAQKTAIE